MTDNFLRNIFLSFFFLIWNKALLYLHDHRDKLSLSFQIMEIKQIESEKLNHQFYRFFLIENQCFIHFKLFWRSVVFLFWFPYSRLFHSQIPCSYSSPCSLKILLHYLFATLLRSYSTKLRKPR